MQRREADSSNGHYDLNLPPPPDAKFSRDRPRASPLLRPTASYQEDQLQDLLTKAAGTPYEKTLRKFIDSRDNTVGGVSPGARTPFRSSTLSKPDETMSRDHSTPEKDPYKPVTSQLENQAFNAASPALSPTRDDAKSYVEQIVAERKKAIRQSKEKTAHISSSKNERSQKHMRANSNKFRTSKSPERHKWIEDIAKPTARRTWEAELEWRAGNTVMRNSTNHIGPQRSNKNTKWNIAHTRFGEIDILNLHASAQKNKHIMKSATNDARYNPHQHLASHLHDTTPNKGDGENNDNVSRQRIEYESDGSVGHGTNNDEDENENDDHRHYPNARDRFQAWLDKQHAWRARINEKISGARIDISNEKNSHHFVPQIPSKSQELAFVARERDRDQLRAQLSLDVSKAKSTPDNKSLQRRSLSPAIVRDIRLKMSASLSPTRSTRSRKNSFDSESVASVDFQFGKDEDDFILESVVDYLPARVASPNVFDRMGAHINTYTYRALDDTGPPLSYLGTFQPKINESSLEMLKKKKQVDYTQASSAKSNSPTKKKTTSKEELLAQGTPKERAQRRVREFLSKGIWEGIKSKPKGGRGRGRSSSPSIQSPSRPAFGIRSVTSDAVTSKDSINTIAERALEKEKERVRNWSPDGKACRASKAGPVGLGGGYSKRNTTGGFSLFGDSGDSNLSVTERLGKLYAARSARYADTSADALSPPRAAVNEEKAEVSESVKDDVTFQAAEIGNYGDDEFGVGDIGVESQLGKARPKKDAPTDAVDESKELEGDSYTAKELRRLNRRMSVNKESTEKILNQSRYKDTSFEDRTRESVERFMIRRGVSDRLLHEGYTPAPGYYDTNGKSVDSVTKVIAKEMKGSKGYTFGRSARNLDLSGIAKEAKSAK